MHRSRAELERLVAERTAELRQTQDGLVQAAKLAALGQMSAALAHELNQPLTAMRMQLGSLQLLQRSGRSSEMGEALEQIDSLLVRMTALTGHLKTFARKSPGGLREHLRLDHVLDQALHLLAPRVRSGSVEINRTCSRRIASPTTSVCGSTCRSMPPPLSSTASAQYAPSRQLRILRRGVGCPAQASNALSSRFRGGTSPQLVRPVLYYQAGGRGARFGLGDLLRDRARTGRQPRGLQRS